MGSIYPYAAFYDTDSRIAYAKRKDYEGYSFRGNKSAAEQVIICQVMNRFFDDDARSKISLIECNAQDVFEVISHRAYKVNRKAVVVIILANMPIQKFTKGIAHHILNVKMFFMV